MLQVALTLGFVGFAAWYLWQQWAGASVSDVEFDFDLPWLLAASLVTFAAFALLIETWRQVLGRLGAPVAFGPAARVWFASNLGKYVPGKIWQLSAMTLMIGEYGVSLAVAGASAVVMTIANVATGFAIVLLTSTATVRQLAGGLAGVAVATIALALCLVAAPLLARQWNSFAARIGRDRLTVTVPLSAVWIALGGCAVSWVLYGIAFKLFVLSIVGSTPAPLEAYITANAAAYLVGYLALFAPGGVGVRELVLTSILVPLRIATAPQAVVITIGSRLWLTVLEVLPGVAALLARKRQTRGSRIP
ncbi:MAG: lysylphosphatidylglycerol synthase domain-containing protein [Gemmatimonadaceae bacterium]